MKTIKKKKKDYIWSLEEASPLLVEEGVLNHYPESA